jgi:CheY-like chemotaxis protein
MDPFFTTKEAGKGTGMGLAMAYSTMRAHKGDIAIESELGLGTCVRLRFPACELAIQAIRQVPTSHPSPLSRSLTVLLVDDDALVLNATEAMLTGLGHRVVAALKGEEALTKLETGLAPDLVILDMNMPGLGGAGTLPLLRQRYPALQVILATGLADKVPWDLCKADPLVSLLAKPFGIVELRRHLLPFCRVT